MRIDWPLPIWIEPAPVDTRSLIFGVFEEYYGLGIAFHFSIMAQFLDHWRDGTATVDSICTRLGIDYEKLWIMLSEDHHNTQGNFELGLAFRAMGRRFVLGSTPLAEVERRVSEIDALCDVLIAEGRYLHGQHPVESRHYDNDLHWEGRKHLLAMAAEHRQITAG